MIYIILGLVTWRISSLLVQEDGPWEIFARFRHHVGIRYDSFSKAYGTGMLSDLLLCIWCTSIWVGFGLAIIWRSFTILQGAHLYVLAMSIFDTFVLSTIAIIVDKIVS